MREILFRAKRIDNGEWVYGDLINEPYGMVIQYCEDEIKDKGNCAKTANKKRVKATVDPETVCQYAGLTDKNGRKIFDGDVCEFSAYGENYKGDVRFIKGNFTIWCGKCAPFLDDALEKHSAVVIGNIFDNPELIGEQP